jgi:hypothetical protein
MSKYNCENFSQKIREFALRKSQLDLVLNQFEPKKGILILAETKSLFRPYLLLMKFGGKEFLSRVSTLTIGGHTYQQICEEAKKQKVDIGWYSDQLRDACALDRLNKTEHKKTEITIFRISTSDLGLPKYASEKDVIEKAASLGLKPCPANTTIYRILEYDDTYNRAYIVEEKLVGSVKEYTPAINHGFDNPYISLVHTSGTQDGYYQVDPHQVWVMMLDEGGDSETSSE